LIAGRYLPMKMAGFPAVPGAGARRRPRLQGSRHRRARRTHTYNRLRGTDITMRDKFSRLTEPLVRDNGALRVASWDEALDRAAAGFAAAKAKHGPQSFGLFSCSKTTNELNFLTGKFTRQVIGCSNIDSCNRT